jgi:hypothetical protein
MEYMVIDDESSRKNLMKKYESRKKKEFPYHHINAKYNKNRKNYKNLDYTM